MTGIIITAIICTTVVLLVWLGGRNEEAKVERTHDSPASDLPGVWGQDTRYGSNNRDGGK
jgi:hypothetical protein